MGQKKFIAVWTNETAELMNLKTKDLKWAWILKYSDGLNRRNCNEK